jgi:transketolase
MLSRQNLPILKEAADQAMEGVAHGAYVLSETPLSRTDLILIATGSEVPWRWKPSSFSQSRRSGPAS